MWFDKLLSSSLVPEFLIRLVLRIHFKYRYFKQPKDVESLQEYINNFIEEMKNEQIAIDMDEANVQHYEVPTDFFKIVLGIYKKYSYGYWSDSMKKKNLYKFIGSIRRGYAKFTWISLKIDL